MAENNGFIKLYRSTFDNPIVCKDSDHLAVWIYLLCEATHKERAVMFSSKKITLKAGELTTGRKRISAKLKISESKVQRILKLFENEQQIEQRTDKQCRLISIVNWSEYQIDEQRNEQQMNNDRTTSEQRVNTKQECKNVKNEKNERKEDIFSELNPLLVEPLKDFIDMRKKKKNPPTDRAIKMLLSELDNLSNGNTELAVKILNQSTMNGWLSVYALKGQQNQIQVNKGISGVDAWEKAAKKKEKENGSKENV